MWQRFREIPEWITAQVKMRTVTPDQALAELDAMRTSAVEGRARLGVNALSQHLKSLREKSTPADSEVSMSASNAKRRAPGPSGASKRQRMAF